MICAIPIYRYLHKIVLEDYISAEGKYIKVIYFMNKEKIAIIEKNCLKFTGEIFLKLLLSHYK